MDETAHSYLITSHERRVWWIALAIYLVGVLVFGLTLAGRSLHRWHYPAPSAFGVVLLAPLLGSAIWLVFVFCTRRYGALQLSINSEGLTLVRPTGHSVSVQWADIRVLEYCSEDNGELVFVTDDERVQLYSHGFDADEWQAVYDEILRQTDETAEYHDNYVDFEAGKAKRLNRVTVFFTIVSGIAATALFIWDASNGAGWIVICGLLPMFIYLGAEMPDMGLSRLPLVKVLGFFSIKLLAMLPLSLIVLLVWQPPQFTIPAYKVTWLFYASNFAFFGCMAMALIVQGGYSPRQYLRGPLLGINRYYGLVRNIALVVMVIGFAFKYWNEV